MMDFLDRLFALYRTAVLKFIFIIRNNLAFDLAILVNFAVIFAAEIVQLQFFPYAHLPTTLIWLACASCVLHLLECALHDTPITARIFIKGYTTYFLAVLLWFACVSVFVVVFKLGEIYTENEIVSIPASIIYYGSVLLPIAELIYQSPIRGWKICSAAFHFTETHWLEWLVPHVFLVTLYIIGMDSLMAKEYSYRNLAYLSWLLFHGPFLHLSLLFRGTLFAELHAPTLESQKTAY